MSENPYEAPATAYQKSDRLVEKEKSKKPLSPRYVFVKWLTICSISAAPSFIFGMLLSEHRLPQILGMLSGVMLFVVGYTMVECAKRTQRELERPHLRLVTRIGYGTRIAISIIFPLGIALDVMVGFFAVGLCETLFGAGVFPGPRRSIDPELIPTAFGTYTSFLFTTVVQGVLLNCIVLAYMGLVWAICLVVSAFRAPKS